MKQTILITGSTDGIGKQAAEKLAKDGHQLYLHGRNAAKLAKVIAEMKAASQNDRIGGFVADLSDLDAVRQMAGQVKNELSALDVLINNAGVYKSAQQENKDGLDMRMVVNYLAPYLLTRELLPLLRQSNAPRLLNLSSAAQGPVSEKVLRGTARGGLQDTYAQSKLALTMWSFHLAESEPGLNVIAVNPGSLLDTKMVREGFGRTWSPAGKGADILYQLALSDRYREASGKYFDNDRGDFSRAHPDAYNEMKVDQLIRITNDLLTT